MSRFISTLNTWLNKENKQLTKPILRLLPRSMSMGLSSSSSGQAQARLAAGTQNTRSGAGQDSEVRTVWIKDSNNK